MRSDLLVLFTRPFWLDEWFTYLVSNHDSIGEVFSDLKRGADFGPPFFYLVGWAIRAITGSITPTSLRIVTFVAMLGALVFVFLILRRRWGAVPAFIAVLAIASNRYLFEYAFEARFYATWMLFAAAFAWALTLDRDKPRSRRRDILLAVSAVLLCTNHWYGVISLGLMAAAVVATFGRQWREGLRLVAPGAAGIVALLLASPLMFGQRGSIVEKTWVQDLNRFQVATMLGTFWWAIVPVAAVLVMLVGVLLPNRKAPLRESLAYAVRDPGVAALFAHVVMPLVLIVLSLQQPSMLPRYALVTLFAWAPLVAIAAKSLGIAGRSVATAILLAALGSRILLTAKEKLDFAIGVATAKQNLELACGAGLPIVVQSRHVLYPVMADSPTACPHVRFLVLSDSTINRILPGGPPFSFTRRFQRFEREFAGHHERIYGFPRSVSEAQLDSVPEFFLLASGPNLPPGYDNVERFVAAVFPNRQTTHYSSGIALVKRPNEAPR